MNIDTTSESRNVNICIEKNNANMIMSFLNYCSKFLRRYILCPESLIFIFLVVVIYNTVINIGPLFQKARDKLRFRATNLQTPPGLNINQAWNNDAGPHKTSWENITGSAAVYAIQGRRPHMEDRFDMIVNHKTHSFYGIFDGHGGDVSINACGADPCTTVHRTSLRLRG